MHCDAKRQLQDFLNTLRHEKRASPHTVDSYQRDLSRLQSYLSSSQFSLWREVKAHDIRQYLAMRHRNGIGSKTLQRELSSMRSFFNFLLKKKQLEINPANQIKAPKHESRLPKVLNVDQIHGMLENPADSHLESRDLAMFELFYSSGLRLSELVALDLADIDFTQNMLRVRYGKGGKQRDLPIGLKAITAIRRWLHLRPASTDPALFLSNRGTRLGQRSIQLRLNRWCKKTGIPERVHPHMLRHSFASHLLETSHDIRAVQELLGHSNISSTQIYTHLDFQHLAEIYDHTHPRARKNPKK